MSSIECTASKSTLIATLGIAETCDKTGAEISFSVDDVVNAPTMVESSAIKAYWTSKEYMSVSEYYNDVPTTIKTLTPAILDGTFFKYY